MRASAGRRLRHARVCARAGVRSEAPTAGASGSRGASNVALARQERARGGRPGLAARAPGLWLLRITERDFGAGATKDPGLVGPPRSSTDAAAPHRSQARPF